MHLFVGWALLLFPTEGCRLYPLETKNSASTRFWKIQIWINPNRCTTKHLLFSSCENQSECKIVEFLVVFSFCIYWFGVTFINFLYNFAQEHILRTSSIFIWFLRFCVRCILQLFSPERIYCEKWQDDWCDAITNYMRDGVRAYYYYFNERSASAICVHGIKTWRTFIMAQRVD